MVTTARCDGCGTTRPLHELLIIRDCHAPERAPWYCCRPGFEGRAGCLRFACGPAADYSIALAIPDPPPVPRPHVERPAPVPVQPFRPGRLVIANDATDNGGPWWSDRAASRRRVPAVVATVGRRDEPDGAA